jgi:5,10-methylenetetrahydromethanopterin reductase
MSAGIRLSVGIPPGPGSVELAQLAEGLGYERAWLYDSAALYEDIWVHLALIATATERIGLGTAVLVPNLRHVMTTASAIATIERLAPGRLACAFGTGATARWVLDQKALSWATMRTYLTQLKGLLRGDVVEIDGKQCQMIHHPRWAAPRPIEVPILVSAFGPKGQEVARDLADGVMAMGGITGWDWNVQMVNGTVLDDGETVADERVKQAVGPWYVVAYHGIWQAMPEAVDGMPLGAEWRAAIEAERPEGQRHLAVHEGHVTDVTPRDRAVLDAAGEALGRGWVRSRAGIREMAEAAVAAGATELLYTPAGPDLHREVEAFADAVLG